MRVRLRDRKLRRASLLLFICLCLSFSPLGYCEKLIVSYQFATLGNPKYPQNFSHLDYVNPNAPKGGDVTLSALGSFDNLNFYATRGSAPAGIERVNDTLFTHSQDEVGVYYPLIAQYFRHNPQLTYLEIVLNPHARFHDGTPITAQDVAFTFHALMTQGIVQFRQFYQGINVTVLSPNTVAFQLPRANRQQALSLLSLPVLPKHFWQGKDLGAPITTPPIGSGPYKIEKFTLGQSICYQRVKNYWAQNLPINKGLYNFDHIRYDYYQDDNVALEAFKAGAYDYRNEIQPKNWFTQYIGTNFAHHYIIKTELDNRRPKPTQWLAFNIDHPIFADRQVREAITLAFDFEWLNKHLYNNAFKRSSSFFQDTPYQAHGYPSQDELTWLTPLADDIPKEVFSSVWLPPESDSSGYNRKNLIHALTLLQQAGYELKHQTLINKKTGKPFRFELVAYQSGFTQYMIPFKNNLARIGIDMEIQLVDSAQFSYRQRKRDFDMMFYVYQPYPYPSTGLQIDWGSAYSHSSYNSTGFTSPAVDQLLKNIVDHQADPCALAALGPALDRVLLWNHLMIPLWYYPKDYLAYWNKFGRPTHAPQYDIGFNSWWIDTQKLAKLPVKSRQLTTISELSMNKE